MCPRGITLAGVNQSVAHYIVHHELTERHNYTATIGRQSSRRVHQENSEFSRIWARIRCCANHNIMSVFIICVKQTKKWHISGAFQRVIQMVTRAIGCSISCMETRIFVTRTRLIWNGASLIFSGVTILFSSWNSTRLD